MLGGQVCTPTSELSACRQLLILDVILSDSPVHFSDRVSLSHQTWDSVIKWATWTVSSRHLPISPLPSTELLAGRLRIQTGTISSDLRGAF